VTIDFWSIVGRNVNSDRSDTDAAIAAIEERLKALDVARLVEFQDQLGQQLHRLDQGSLASIGVEFPGMSARGQTEDHFLYARCACILTGEEAVRSVLADPARFGDFVAPRLQAAELLLYVAHQEYESRTGERMKVRRPYS
jgi:hypothetical protein